MHERLLRIEHKQKLGKIETPKEVKTLLSCINSCINKCPLCIFVDGIE